MHLSVHTALAELHYWSCLVFRAGSFVVYYDRKLANKLKENQHICKFSAKVTLANGSISTLEYSTNRLINQDHREVNGTRFILRLCF